MYRVLYILLQSQRNAKKHTTPKHRTFITASLSRLSVIVAQHFNYFTDFMADISTPLSIVQYVI